MHRWPSLQRRRIEILGRLVKSMLSNCSKMLILGTYWTTRYSMVSDETCTINHKMDQSLWQTPESIDFVHSSYMWIQTILSCGKHCKSMEVGTVSGLWLCRRAWRPKIDLRRNYVHIWKSHVRSRKLDTCKKQTSVSHNSTESEIISLACRIKDRR